MESARRWSGFVCPDCRFVFRVPRDHDGQGIICPSCRRMLRIPTSRDNPPALLVPLRRITADEVAAEAATEGPPQEMVRKRRRSKKSGEDHSWEHDPGGLHSHRGERRQMTIFLIGGVVMLGLVLAGTVVFMRDQKPAAGQSVPTPAVMRENAPKVPAVVARGDQEVLAEAEPLSRKFLDANTVDELLKLVRHPEITGPRIRKLYPDGKVPAPGMSRFNATGSITMTGNFRSITVVTGDFDNKVLVVTDTPGDMKVDWESWIGWSDMSWEEFRKTRPVTEQVFRVILSEVDYYNFDFKDDSHWQSYRLESPDREHALYAYAEKGSTLDQRLRLGPDLKSTPRMLALKFPEGATGGDQVQITRFVTDGWIEEDISK